jgi:hypothetical protein
MCLKKIGISYPQIINTFSNNKFYNIGINNDLIFCGYIVNNYYIYTIIITYIIINSIIRSCVNNMLLNNKSSYKITIITTLYEWYDWYINVNLLLTQIDLFIYDLFTNIVISNLIVKYYLTQHNYVELEEIIISKIN